MSAPPPQRPPAPGGRRALDAAWLAHLRAGAPLPSHDGMSASPAWAEALALTNAGAHHAAHEAWEACWRTAPYPQRLLPLALAKLTAAPLLAQRGERGERGALRLHAQAAALLAPFPPCYGGMDIEALRQEAAQAPSSRGVRLIQAQVDG